VRAILVTASGYGNCSTDSNFLGPGSGQLHEFFLTNLNRSYLLLHNGSGLFELNIGTLSDCGNRGIQIDRLRESLDGIVTSDQAGYLYYMAAGVSCLGDPEELEVYLTIGASGQDFDILSGCTYLTQGPLSTINAGVSPTAVLSSCEEPFTISGGSPQQFIVNPCLGDTPVITVQLVT
jgi:hypothetical protein